jgi:hypothetical protein
MAVDERDPELWKSSAPGPWAALERERGTVTIWAVGGDRYVVHSPDGAHSVRCHDAAVWLTQKLAEQLGPAINRG